MMTSATVPFLAALSGAFVGGAAALLAGYLNDRRVSRAARITEVRRLVAEFAAYARMMVDVVEATAGRTPPDARLEDPRFEAYELEFYKARTQLRWAVRSSRLAVHVNDVDNAVGRTVEARHRPTHELQRTSAEVDRMARILEATVNHFEGRGAAYFDRELTARRLPNPAPASLREGEPPTARQVFVRALPPARVKAWRSARAVRRRAAQAARARTGRR